jgi:hypothetical protein
VKTGVIVVAFGLTLGVGAGCLPSYTFATGNEEGGGDAVPGPDATGDGASPGSDASADATVTPEGSADAPATGEGGDASDGGAAGDGQAAGDGAIVAVLLADAGGQAGSTGFGEQTHIIHTENSGDYWLFYVDGTSGAIKTRHSPDLTNWADGEVLSVGAAAGSDFSVAYANLGGTDVVHLVINATLTGGRTATVHVRATIAGGHATFSLPAMLPDTDSQTSGNGAGTCPYDAPSVTVLPSGRIYDVTAWTIHPSTTCDTNIYVTSNLDVGGTGFWAPSFAHDGYYVSVPSYAYSHELVALPDAGQVLAAYPDNDNTDIHQFDGVGWALSSTLVFDAGAPGTTGIVESAATEVFVTNGTHMSENDWAMCRLTDATVHLVRHVTDPGGSTVTAFEESYFDGSQWLGTVAPPSTQSRSNTGVVLLSKKDPALGMLLVTIGSDNALHVAKWMSAGGWRTLPPLFTTPAARQSLAGSGCGSARPYVIWTEGTSPYAIMGADLSSLL